MTTFIFAGDVIVEVALSRPGTHAITEMVNLRLSKRTAAALRDELTIALKELEPAAAPDPLTVDMISPVWDSVAQAQAEQDVF